MKKEIPKAYNPQEVEDEIYKKWEESGKFNPDNLELQEDAERFSISMPPPNATGVLHLGHASMLAYQDLMIRYNRMRGRSTLWLPGTDHASIATQTKVEKIIAEKGQTKYDLGREKFLERIDEYIENSKSTIKNQTRKMGSSCDWSRERYTLDDGLSRAVAEVFVKMYNDGLIYRGDRIVNWCPRCESTLADDEVEHKDQKANLYYFKYNKDFPITIATTRPETKLGDTAVAVNPKDKRYEKYIGQVFEINLGNGVHQIKIIADREVEMEFGTGALGVTPAHSMTDWEMAEKNGLEKIKIIGEDGKMNTSAGKSYEGLTVLKAREKIVKYLKENNLIEKVEEVDQSLSVCYRCGASIEPLPSKQWFVDVNQKVTIKDNKYFQNKSLKDIAVEVVKNEEIKIIPERFKKTYFHWMENLRDWCISRQIWFGHKIPVWYKDEPKVDVTYFVHGTTIDNEKDRASGHYDVELSKLGIQQSKDLKDVIKDQKFDIVFCSDLKRAVQTAEIVFGDSGQNSHSTSFSKEKKTRKERFEIVKDERLRECDYGDLTQTQVSKILAIEKDAINKPFPNGESYEDVKERMESFLDDVMNNYEGKKIAIVAHKAPQLALDVILKNKTWEQAIDEDWRKAKEWKSGWKYELKVYTQTNFVFLRGFLRTSNVKDPLSWLNKKLLNKDNFYCELPNSNKPNLQEQIGFVIDNAKINENTVIVAHSIGCILAMKLIEKNNLKIKKLVLIASPMQTQETVDGKKREESGNYGDGKFDFDKIKKLVGEIVVFSDNNDHVILPDEPKIIAEKLNAKLVEIEAPASHFNCEKCEEILEELENKKNQEIYVGTKLLEGNSWTQDEDTLDTWFSSGLWTFSTLLDQNHEKHKTFEDWVASSPDLKKFHPTSVMETGYDILFFWIARMILMTTYTLGEVPFENVYLHGMLRDKQGRKMSKSLGNGIDPIEMINKYGTDALRLSMIIGSSPGNDIKMYEEKIEGYRNFVNKLWNVSRYIIMNQESRIKNNEINYENLTFADKWILRNLNNLIEEVTDDLDNYRFSQAGEKIKEFTWNDFADWYIEVSKIEKNKDEILNYILKQLLILSHPFIPFVTEEIWKNFKHTPNSSQEGNSLLMIEKWPEKKYLDLNNAEGYIFVKVQNIVSAIRKIRAEYKVEPNKRIDATIYAEKDYDLIKDEGVLIKNLRTGIDKLEIKENGEKIKDAVYLVVGDIEIYLRGVIDKEKEKNNLEKEIENIEKYIEQIRKKLGNDSFVENAPMEVVEKERNKYQESMTKIEKLKRKLELFNN